MQLTPSKIKHSFACLKPKNSWAFKSASRSETNAFSHSYHRYPAKFIPQLVQRLISENTSERDLICDPFGGCGTTLVESKLSGRRSIGVDINPVAKLITQTKTTPINPKKLNRNIEVFLKNYQRINIKKKEYVNGDRLQYWFDSRTISRLNKIYTAIHTIPDDDVRRFFLCAFSHNLKNSSRWLMKSIKPTIDKHKKIADPFLSFKKHLLSMQKKNDVFYKHLSNIGRLKVSTKFYRKDATKRLPINNNTVDLVITSPPYVTSYEYADLHQLPLIWFGHDPKNFKHWDKLPEDFNLFKKKFVGTRLKKNQYDELHSKIAENIVADLQSINSSLARDVANYFSDMYKSFSEIYRILKKSKKACVIIGNTVLHDIDILNAEVVAEQMTNIGFKKVSFIKRELPNKAITPWRDKKTGKFTGKSNRNKRIAYQYEYLVIMKK